MIWFWIVFIIVFVLGWDKVTASAKGERVCVHCGKRLKFSHNTGHYTNVCPRCGRDQNR